MIEFPADDPARARRFWAGLLGVDLRAREPGEGEGWQTRWEQHAAQAGNQDQLRKWVNGKIVLVGTDFVDDRFDTPFYTLFSGSKWTMPGVEIHANTVRTLLARSYLVPAPQWGLALALMLATSATVWIVTSFAAGRAVGLVLLEVLGILAATHLLFQRGLILSTSEVLLATSVSLIASEVDGINPRWNNRCIAAEALPAAPGRRRGRPRKK